VLAPFGSKIIRICCIRLLFPAFHQILPFKRTLRRSHLRRVRIACDKIWKGLQKEANPHAVKLKVLRQIGQIENKHPALIIHRSGLPTIIALLQTVAKPWELKIAYSLYIQWISPRQATICFPKKLALGVFGNWRATFGNQYNFILEIESRWYWALRKIFFGFIGNLLGKLIIFFNLFINFKIYIVKWLN
jgi:hypothetical protein